MENGCLENVINSHSNFKTLAEGFKTLVWWYKELKFLNVSCEEVLSNPHINTF